MDQKNLYALCFSDDKKEMAINVNNIKKESTDLRSFNNNADRIFETEKGNIRSFEMGGETITLIFFKESNDVFY